MESRRYRDDRAGFGNVNLDIVFNDGRSLADEFGNKMITKITCLEP